MNAVGNKNTTKPRPWWVELALVDFRHAFWPWVVYFAAVMGLWLMPLGPLDKVASEMNLWVWIAAAVALAGPALVARVHATDFANDTLSTMLSSPRRRSSIWFVRTGGAALLLFVPLILSAIPMPHLWTTWKSPDQFMLKAAVVTLGSMAWCYATVGAFLAILLKRPLLVWSAVLISPLLVPLLSVLVDAVTGLNLMLKPGYQLKGPIPLYFWFNIIFGAVAYIIAWRLWLRLEVRS